ncbi:hypothetical protein EI555_011573 [Monodon monoceros]|uniref:Uncharacterized protein n=1 Tax=Monodon monoceros TaxID=40151 RepID=A0A4V5PAM2_MONMO|nr:hypothetical protein EI555_011573 [Monodon monoceros]
MYCAFFSSCAFGCTASSLHATGPSTPPSLIKHADWDTRPSKVMSHIRFL